ncbi:MAG: putative ribosomal protein L24 [Streblomastix strix]|uniref:Putative ribosomal protein L24 n=1 Tax=Streblomastix strix TaxID=222440 RepID=A0A5J4WY20_9EUKA|nr:MAG: putative ribosomal protein L24 [Streblomastix strix]
MGAANNNPIQNLGLHTRAMRTERCTFSWRKIYPGHGIRFVRGDSRLFHFSGSKARRCYQIKRSSRNTVWTGEWRKAHKKDTATHLKKRVRKRAVRFQRDIVGMTLEDLRKARAGKVIEKTTDAEAAQKKELKERQKKQTEQQRKQKKQEKKGVFQKNVAPKGR